VGGRPRATVQGSNDQGGDEGKEEEKRSMVSKSLESWEKWEEEDKDRWEEKEGRCNKQRNRGRYGRDEVFAVEYVTAVASTDQNPVPLLHVFLGVKDCHLLADSCAAPQLPVPAFLHIGSVLPVEESRILIDDSQLLALARPSQLGHIGGGEEVEGDGDTTMEAHAEGQESGEGGEEDVDGEEQLHENGMRCRR